MEPTTLAQARLLPDAAHWDAAVKAELKSLGNKGTFESLSTKPPGVRLLGTKWVFKLKKCADGTLDKYKARLVAKGFLQRFGVDYFETFAPCTQLSSFRLILAISIAYNLELTHMDVQTAFLNSDLKEELYIQLPEGAVTEDGHYMAKLKKSLYGLKQAGHDWHSTSEDFILSYDNRLRRSSVEPCLYYFINEDIKIFILTQVDDYIVACNTKNWVLNFITAFNSKYSVNVLGKLSHFMQMEITFEHNRVTLSQQRTIEDLAATFDLTDCKPMGLQDEDTYV